MEQPNFLLSSESWPELTKKTNGKQVKRDKKCDICPFVTHSNQNLKKHKKIHEKVTPLNYECNVCDKSFKQKKALSDHKRTHNEKDKNNKCGLCEYETHKTFNLKKHQKVS